MRYVWLDGRRKGGLMKDMKNPIFRVYCPRCGYQRYLEIDVWKEMEDLERYLDRLKKEWGDDETASTD